MGYRQQIDQAFDIAVRMTESRRVLQNLHGDKYTERLAPVIHALTTVMRKESKTATAAAMVLLVRTQYNEHAGQLALHICAAAAEVIDAES